MSIQPHGVLLVVQQPQLRVVQASANLPGLLQRPLSWLLDATLRDLGGDIDKQVRALATTSSLRDGQPLHCSLVAGGRALTLEGRLHRDTSGLLIAELDLPDATAADVGPPQLAQLRAAVQHLSEAATLPALAGALAVSLRQLLGHAQVSVLRLQPDGSHVRLAHSHDRAVSPAVEPDDAEGEAMSALRLVVDAHADSVALMPDGAVAPDLSMCILRSPSPRQLRQLAARGAVASLQLPLMREGRPWGLVCCHHHQRRAVPQALCAAAELLAEVACTRVAAIEQYGRSQATAQAMAHVRQLRQRLLDAAAGEGDWRLALLHDPVALLQPLNAGGAALLQQGHALSCGHAPAGAALDALAQWISQQPTDGGAVACNALAAANPTLHAMAPKVSGVLALPLSVGQPDYLMWFRTPQQQAPAWSGADVAVAQAFADALVDVTVQVDAVRLLIAEQQAAQLRVAVASSREPVVVADATGCSFHANDAFLALAGCTRAQCTSLDALVGRFEDPALARQVIGQVQAQGRPWRGELAMAVTGGAGHVAALPVALRAEPVPARNGALLGMILIFNDLSHSKRADAARQHLEASLSQAGRRIGARPRTGQQGGHQGLPATADGLLAAILTNASLAAMDIAEGGGASEPLLQDLQASTERAAALCDRIRGFSATRPS